MTSGIPLSEKEKEIIRAEITIKSKRQLAQQLSRSRKTIKNFVDSEGLEKD